jgi:hypothetical protein
MVASACVLGSLSEGSAARDIERHIVSGLHEEW